ncbi:BTAD domain-containing putative transcriptional regulator [Amycolatopsis sp. 195334CR]|uniref:AfsR/SARP family transcriptional regulator n=1 Tax=Amycolatopsis sp. 195334CR TaxID=2814588 RepID=UPI001A8F16DA|nr:BTAD domain-containing putative transcriptional regulator [Amycolatopsis sp. 195334CR]MBN6040317.1 tetratricopeptide repeat protein [Amycolatopsis sp. 195334CR]
MGVLGELEVRSAGEPVPAGHSRRRAVLVVLAVEANRVVTVDSLIDRVWGDEAPSRVRPVLRTYLTHLRRAVAEAGAAIERRDTGYVLVIESDRVDVHRFHRLLALAREQEDPHRSLQLVDEALALWRGKPLAELATPWADSVRERLELEKATADADRVDWALECGRHQELLPELTTRSHDRPLDERAAAQLMLALYRGDQQAAALAHYRRTRQALVDELGTEPAPPLQELHQRILVADPALTPRPDSAPRQLPASPSLFIGREADLAELDKAAQNSGTTRLVAVTGMGGVGKTWLALRWAHQNLHLFPDGQLYVDLRGYTTSGPLRPEVAVRGFLEALGVAADAVPSGLDAQTALFRSRVADKRLLVVLDNARDSDHVRPLLPGSGWCTTLVTSRSQLTALAAEHSAGRMTLDTLSPQDEHRLLASRLGEERVGAEPEAVSVILDRCAGLPLALGVVAALAANNPEFPLQATADDLVAAPLDALETGELTSGVRAAFAASLAGLSPAARRMFALLGQAVVPEISGEAAAAIGDQSLVVARASLRELAAASLVRQPRPGRFTLHDLARHYAAELPAEDGAALRLTEFYLHTAFACERVLEPNRPPIELPPPAVPPWNPADAAAAQAWFAAERANLPAVQRLAFDRGWYAHTWQLAWAQATYSWMRADPHDHVAAWELGLAAAEHEPEVRNLCHRLASRAYVRAGLLEEGLANSRLAWEYARTTEEKAHTQHSLAWVTGQQGDNTAAVEHAEHALALFRELGNPDWEANALNMMAWYLTGLDPERARVCGEQALVLLRAHGSRGGEGATLDTLGHIAATSGAHRDAVGYFQAALVVYRELGYTADEADTFDRIGDAYRELGELAEARRAWDEAITRYRQHNRGEQVSRVEAKLGAAR